MSSFIELPEIKTIVDDLPKILIIEGPDGVGKSKLIQDIVRYNSDHENKKDLRVIAYPGNRDDVPIRSILLDSSVSDHEDCHVFFFLADFVFTFEKYILPYLNNSNTVFIFDRYIPSTCIYQNVTMEYVNSILSHPKFSAFFEGMMQATYLYLLPGKPAEHLVRLSKKRGSEINRFDPKTVNEVKQNVDAYCEIASKHQTTKLIGSTKVVVVEV